MEDEERRKSALEAKKVIKKYVEEEIPKVLEEQKKNYIKMQIAHEESLKLLKFLMLIFIIIEILFIICAIVEKNAYMLLAALLFPIVMFIL